MPVRKYCAVYNLGLEGFHGMEEVVGSNPTRSTIPRISFQLSTQHLGPQEAK